MNTVPDTLIPAEKHSLAHLPTPLDPMPRLSDAWGAEIWIKRDDMTGLAAGGNKARKLEYLVADAFRQGADTLVTTGALQSNHARQTAAAAAAVGLDCHLVLSEAVPGRTFAYHHGGNLILDALVGATVHTVPDPEDTDRVIEETMATLKAAGRKPYLIPTGGSNLVGAFGYVAAALELADQCTKTGTAFDRIVVASGSGGTQAGLVIGSETPVIGISVSSSTADLSAKIAGIVAEADAMEAFAGCSAHPITVDDGYVGPGYGQPTDAMIEAVSTVARLEGILLDPVYSGKAMAGLRAMCRDGRAPGRTLFWHTGGLPALFAYDDVFGETKKVQVDA